MNEIKTICICGGGSLGHVVAGYVAATQPRLDVSVLTNRPSLWADSLSIHTPEGAVLEGRLTAVTDKAEVVIPKANVVLLCLPGFAIKEELLKIKPFLQSGTYVGGIFCSTGFFFEALKVLGEDIRLWGFQRVPFIARTVEYGHAANLLGFKDSFSIAVERATDADKESFRLWVEESFGRPTCLLSNYLEASITNSNPLLHTSRLYTMFKDWHDGITYPHNIKFYEEWTEEASDLYIKMDNELFDLLKVLPVSQGFLTPVLEYYESVDAATLTKKIQSISSFKGIMSPMKEIASDHWIPDYTSRYFTEDFGYSLRYIYELATANKINTPLIYKVYQWGKSKL